MIKVIVSISMSLIALTSTSIQAESLIVYGKKCLQKETQLKQAKDVFDQEKLNLEIRRSNQRKAIKTLDTYTQEITELEDTLKRCDEKELDRAYCHKIRSRHSQLVFLKEKAQLENNQEWQETSNNLLDSEYGIENYEEDYEHFIQFCRNSNKHYQMINDQDAYQAVCIDSKAKESLTCSHL